MSEATNAFEVVTVPAQLKVQIGKRTRSFDDTPEGREKMQKAIETFQNGGRVNKGIMAARKAAKARMEGIKAKLTAFVVDSGLAEAETKKCAGLVNTYYDLCEKKPGVYTELTGEEYPAPAEVVEGTNEEVEEGSEATDTTTEGGEDTGEDTIDPLAGLSAE